MRTERIRLSSGRSVAVHRVAEGNRDTVVLCHSAPGAGPFDPDPAQTARRGLTLLTVDRPGYGGSDRLDDDAWATVGQAADDLAEVLRRAGIERANAAGWSAGGRVALAIAARHPDLVERVAVIATPAPNEAVRWLPTEQAAALEALRGKPAVEVHAALARQLAGLVPPPGHAADALTQLTSPADAHTLEDEATRSRLSQMLEHAYAQGMAGIATDLAGYSLQPWGFEPADVSAKTLLVYGAKDPIAGSSHGRWWQRHLPDARLEMTPDAGHLLVVERWGRVLSFLAPSR